MPQKLELVKRFGLFPCPERGFKKDSTIVPALALSTPETSVLVEGRLHGGHGHAPLMHVDVRVDAESDAGALVPGELLHDGRVRALLRGHAEKQVPS